MTKKRLWVITGVASAAALAAVPALTATAYPPSAKLSAAPSLVAGKITLANTQKGCVYELKSRGSTTTVIGTGSTVDATAPIGTKTGLYTITVHTTKTGCTGPSENAVAKLGVTAYKVTAAKRTVSGSKFAVKAGGWSSESKVTFVLSGGGKTLLSKGVKPTDAGDASYTFVAPKKPGTYVVTVVQGKATQSYTVVVTAKAVQKPKATKPTKKPTKKPAPKKPAAKKPARY